tara:strand:- start:10198 stop:10494 length:297 start_codon:yes stop_codon:yes gene_type:complete
MKEYSTPKAMKQIGALFDRYKNHFKPPQSSVEKTAQEVIKEITKFSIDLEKISFTVSTKTLALNVPSVLKNEIMFKQEIIIKALQDKLGKDSAPTKLF